MTAFERHLVLLFLCFVVVVFLTVQVGWVPTLLGVAFLLIELALRDSVRQRSRRSRPLD